MAKLDIRDSPPFARHSRLPVLAAPVPPHGLRSDYRLPPGRSQPARRVSRFDRWIRPPTSLAVPPPAPARRQSKPYRQNRSAPPLESESSAHYSAGLERSLPPHTCPLSK